MVSALHCALALRPALLPAGLTLRGPRKALMLHDTVVGTSLHASPLHLPESLSGLTWPMSSPGLTAEPGDGGSRVQTSAHAHLGSWPRSCCQRREGALTAPHQVPCREGLAAALHWQQHRELSLTGLPPGLQFSLPVTPPITLSPSATQFLGRVVVRDAAIKERDPVSLYFQFALCPYPPPPAPPSPVPCLGSEEGRCSRRPGPVAVNHWSAAQNDAPEGRGSRSSPQAASLLCTYLAQAPAPPLHPFRPGAEGVFGEKKRAAALQPTPYS